MRPVAGHRTRAGRSYHPAGRYRNIRSKPVILDDCSDDDARSRRGMMHWYGKIETPPLTTAPAFEIPHQVDSTPRKGYDKVWDNFKGKPGNEAPHLNTKNRNHFTRLWNRGHRKKVSLFWSSRGTSLGTGRTP